jgi:hypothetical protein
MWSLGPRPPGNVTGNRNLARNPGAGQTAMLPPPTGGKAGVSTTPEANYLAGSVMGAPQGPADLASGSRRSYG